MDITDRQKLPRQTNQEKQGTTKQSISSAQQPQENKPNSVSDAPAPEQLIDFDIFFENKANEMDNESDKCTHKVNECKPIKRVIAGLIYYEMLNKRQTENRSGQRIFSEFLCEMYANYLDDIAHFVVSHDKDL
eukprot:UN04762